MVRVICVNLNILFAKISNKMDWRQPMKEDMYMKTTSVVQ